MPEATVSRFSISTAVSIERRGAEWRLLTLCDFHATSLLTI